MALVFAACSNDTTDTSSGGNVGGNNPSSGKIPTNITIVDGPTTTQRFEGLPIDLTGIRLLVQYAGETGVTAVTDTSRMRVDPPIYRADYSNYTLTYSEGNGSDTENLVISGIIPLVRVVHTGNLTKQDYFVDDIPTFQGPVIEGVYGTQEVSVGAGSEADWYQKVIPVAQYPHYYEWAWVYNDTVPNIDVNDQFVGQNPGLLLKVGSYGNLTPGHVVDTSLTGNRFTVTNLYQVNAIAFSVDQITPTEPIFADDPSIISYDAFKGEEGKAKWKELMGGVTVTASYLGTTQTKTWTVEQMEWINPFDGTYGGIWDAPKLAFFKSADPKNPGYNAAAITGDTDVADTSTGWMAKKNRSIFVEYRGVKDFVTVPVYDRLDSITAVPRAGAEHTIVLNGIDEVYHRPDGESALLDQLLVSATYLDTVNVDRAPGVRADLGFDIGKGICQWYNNTTGTSVSTNLVTGRILSEANQASYLKDNTKTKDVTITFRSTGSDNTEEYGRKTAKVAIGQSGYNY